MKYLEKYNRYIDDDCVIYRKDREGKLVQVKPSVNNCGYEFICYKECRIVLVHRLVYEAFKGEIPEGLEIDHIDRNKRNNNPDNLRVVTRSENMRNVDKKSRKAVTDFGAKFKEHFKTTRTDSPSLYHREWEYCARHKKCRWE